VALHPPEFDNELFRPLFEVAEIAKFTEEELRISSSFAILLNIAFFSQFKRFSPFFSLLPLLFLRKNSIFIS
jgi:hypothetical protein